MTIDRTGNYGGYIYLATGCSDDIRRISTTGAVTTLSAWPGSATGGPYGIDIDPGPLMGD